MMLPVIYEHGGRTRRGSSSNDGRRASSPNHFSSTSSDEEHNSDDGGDGLIDDRGGSNRSNDSSSSSSSSSTWCENYNNMSNTIIWPPEGSVVWPPGNYDEFRDGITVGGGGSSSSSNPYFVDGGAPCTDGAGSGHNRGDGKAQRRNNYGSNHEESPNLYINQMMSQSPTSSPSSSDSEDDDDYHSTSHHRIERHGRTRSHHHLADETRETEEDQDNSLNYSISSFPSNNTSATSSFSLFTGGLFQFLSSPLRKHSSSWGSEATPLHSNVHHDDQGYDAIVTTNEKNNAAHPLPLHPNFHPSYNNLSYYNHDHSYNPSHNNRQRNSRHLSNSQHHYRILRIWQFLSILGMLAFCLSLVVIPSVLQGEEGMVGGISSGSASSNNGRGGDGINVIRGGSKAQKQYNDVDDNDDDVEDGEDESSSWEYLKPWKYFYGSNNNDTHDVGEDNGDGGGKVATADGGAEVSSSSSSPSPNTATSSDAASSNDDDNVDDGSSTDSLVDINISFANLASVMLPPYFQTTLEMCKSTIVSSEHVHNDRHHSNGKQDKKKEKGVKHNGKHRVLAKKKEGNKGNSFKHDETKVITTTTVLPSQVFDLRKQMLKTRDLFDVFSSVYPKRNPLYHTGDLDIETRDSVLWIEEGRSLDFELTLESGETKHHHGGSSQTHSRTYDHAKKKKKTSGVKSAKKRSKSKDDGVTDLWRTLRKYLDDGYTIIGEFQDLDHAKIKFSPEKLAQYQLQVWEWHVGFMEMVERNYLNIMEYLSHPCPDANGAGGVNGSRRGSKQSKNKSKKVADVEDDNDSTIFAEQQCRYSHSKSSHLFWGGTAEAELPDGNEDTATESLGRLGADQLGRSLIYLNKLWSKDHVIPKAEVDAPVESKPKKNSPLQKEEYKPPPHEGEEDADVQEIYHNLRKELRSFLDEVDLFGRLLLPDTSLQPEVIVLDNVRERSALLALEIDFEDDQDTDDHGPKVDTASDVDITDSEDVEPQFDSETSDANVTVTGDAEQAVESHTTEAVEDMPSTGDQNLTVDDTDGSESSTNATKADETLPVTAVPPASDQAIEVSDGLGPQIVKPSPKHETMLALVALKQTRKLLGDLNDDYTAYTKYVEWNTNPGEQVRLIDDIETQFSSFLSWAQEVDLNGKIEHLRERMTAKAEASEEAHAVQNTIG